MTQHYGVGTHPDLPPYLVHFTGRPRGGYPPPDGVPVAPEARLAYIMNLGYILGFPTFGSVGRVACASEVTSAGLTALFSTGVTNRGPYEPWAVVLGREKAIEIGFRPVWYMSDDEQRVTNYLPIAMRDRRVTYNPGQTDWLAEREWRYCWGDAQTPPGHVPAIGLIGLLIAVIVGRSGWQPPHGQVTPSLAGTPRLLWTPHGLVADGELRS
ncbi:hypothetical protein ABZ342_22580 [Amycolatopsis sp. NPDC005961]|uniref:hypothetical protein n=1 Tax=Amycolatopsis sp. NPDC005961 TaxID=3156720 RepID=UPI0033DCD466